MPDLFRQAPDEVIRYFEAKGQRPTFHWRDIATEEHALTFTVAKTTGYDVLGDLRKAVGEAIRNQQSFEEFRASIQPVLEARGWWGRKMMTDPRNGLPGMAQLGSPRRLRVIYWANLSTARAAGEWERTWRTRDMLPYLRYTLSNSERLRPEHKSWVGTILPVDHPWWQTHYPPNGWLCKCGVRQMTRRQAERAGYDGKAEAPPVEMRAWHDKRNGRRIQVPAGIDPGWAQNPGYERGLNVGRFLGEQLETMPADARKAAIADLTGSDLFQAIVENRFRYDPVAEPTRAVRSISAPVASLPEAARVALGAKDHIVRLSVADAEKIGRKHPEVNRETYRQLQGMIEKAEPVIDRNGKMVLRLKLGWSHWIAVVKQTRDGELFLNSFFRTNKSYFERVAKR